jgi:hypothetical protein
MMLPPRRSIAMFLLASMVCGLIGSAQATAWSASMKNFGHSIKNGAHSSSS